MKTIAKDLKKYGPWAFMAALVIALLLAFFDASWAVWLLAVLGLVVGFLNIDPKESTPFLMASLVWMIAGEFLGAILGELPLVGAFVQAFLSNVITFVGPAAAVVAIMALYHITKD